MNKNKKISLLILSFSLTLLLLITLTSGAISLASPASNSSHKISTIILNCTNTANSIQNASNATFYYNSSGGTAQEDSGATRLAIVLNSTVNDTEFYVTGTSISGLTNTATYNFSCAVANISTILYGSSKNITIDNVAPVVTSTCTLKVMDVFNPITCTSTCTDAIDGSPTITRTLTKPGSDTVSASTTPITFTGSSTNKIGNYNFGILCTDYATNVNNANATFRADSDEDEDTTTQDQTAQTTQQKLSIRNKQIIMLIILFGASGVVIIAATLMLNKKGKKRKKK